MTHFQRLGSFLTPSSRPLEFSSRICRVMTKFRLFKVGKRRPLNSSFNFMMGTYIWRIRGWGSTSHMWPEVSVISTFYTQYTHTFALHYNKRLLVCLGDYREHASIFFNAHWVSFVPLCALLLKWTSYGLYYKIFIKICMKFEKWFCRNI